MTTPARTYYRACVGRWRSPVQMTVTDPDALRRSGMSWIDRLSLRLLARWPAWLGPVLLFTTVEIDGDEVVHTTTVRWRGISLQRSVETFTLDPDGRRFTVRGGMTGEGEVDEAGERATYALRWLGVDITQRTVREADLVRVEQEGPGFRGTQALARRA